MLPPPPSSSSSPALTPTLPLSVDRLRKDGVYGGNDTIVAAARHFNVDIVIHHLGQARSVLRVCV
jgi:hypothetical protein